MIKAFFHFPHTLNKLFNNCIKLNWSQISSSWNKKSLNKKNKKSLKRSNLTSSEEKLPLKILALLGLSNKIQATQDPYVIKNLSNVIMKRSPLKNKWFIIVTAESLWSYKKQNNFCSKLHKKERKKYYSNLNLNKVTDNKTFSKAIEEQIKELIKEQI